MKIHYYLFGEQICNIYFSACFEDVLKLAALPKTDTALAQFKTTDNPTDLLAAYDGWNGFAEITENEYLQLSKVIKGAKS
jgi:hypothetical protein